MRRLLLEVYNAFVSPIPIGVGRRFKIHFLRLCGVRMGKSCLLYPHVTIRGAGKLSIGNHVVLKSGVVIECGEQGEVTIGDEVEINHGTLIAANGISRITIGDHVEIAHFVSLKGSTHVVDPNGPCIAGKSQYKDISIGSGSWLCTGCVVLPGIRVGMKNVIAAGAVIIGDTPDYALMCGVPGVMKKQYRVGTSG